MQPTQDMAAIAQADVFFPENGAIDITRPADQCSRTINVIVEDRAASEADVAAAQHHSAYSFAVRIVKRTELPFVGDDSGTMLKSRLLARAIQVNAAKGAESFSKVADVIVVA